MLIVLTELETHLIEEHGVKPELVRSARAQFGKDTAEAAARVSHQIMHSVHKNLEHSHDDTDTDTD